MPKTFSVKLWIEIDIIMQITCLSKETNLYNGEVWYRVIFLYQNLKIEAQISACNVIFIMRYELWTIIPPNINSIIEN